MHHASHERDLRSRKIHVTAQRLAVLRAVKTHPHASTETIARVVRTQIGSISRQAVYDVLATLTENGLVRRVQPGGSPALYDPRVGDEHHHAICRRCGAVADVECYAVGTSCIPRPARCDFRVDGAEILYWGVCPNCIAACKTLKPKRRRTAKGPGGFTRAAMTPRPCEK